MDTGTWGLYYNYTWWGNAIQTAPSVIGKPDFFGSQFEMLTSQQPNQVVNGDFATDSDWIFGNGWSYGNGNAVASSGSGTANKLTQTNTLNGKFVKVSLGVSNYGGSGLVLVDFGSTTSSSITSNGAYTLYGTYDQNDFQIFKTADFSGLITNISVQIVRADNVEAVKCLADWIHETQILDV